MTIKILWVDDEIDLLKPHILFLQKKNYEVQTCKSGTEALELIEEENFDIIFLDENMPGLTGLETLAEIKERRETVPVVMITKSEEEYIMEEAIGSKIADYLITNDLRRVFYVDRSMICCNDQFKALLLCFLYDIQ